MIHSEHNCSQSEYTLIESASDALKIELSTARSTWDCDLCLCASRYHNEELISKGRCPARCC